MKWEEIWATITNFATQYAFKILAALIVLVVGRSISGVHWITDIIGGIFISCFLLSLLYQSFIVVENKKKKSYK